MLNLIVRKAIVEGLLEAPPHAAVFYDLDQVAERMAAARSPFPDGTLHALAVKACPLTSLLRLGCERGFGAEVASAVELHHAIRAGIPASRIVFDSPAKTMEELRLALSLGVLVNADNLQELDRIGHLIGEQRGPQRAIGVRLNPEAGAGAIEATSTAMRGSKFGVTLSEQEAEILNAFCKHEWLNAVHVHVGSQGGSIDLMVEGVARVLQFTELVEARLGRGRIRVFDFGGGLSVSYREGERGPEFGEYARALRTRCPRLFTGELQLVTEFGRAIWANSAIAISRVEYTKTSGGRRIATIHLGADMFPRTAYVPDVWRHEISVLDPLGQPKDAPMVVQDIAGPLCFSGDLVARARTLPLIEPGDHVLIHDVGAYTLSMWSRYNSRLSPPVYGVSDTSEELTLLRAGERVEDVVRFWD